jgi:hypothetical protein
MSRLVFRDFGRRAERFPQWVHDLDGESGVYVLRDRRTHEVLYVGESHTGRVRQTLVRHLQRWSRDKDFWRGAGFSRHDPGTTYAREGVEAAVRIVPRGDAVDVQNALIRQLRPRDNVQGADVPRRKRRRRRRARGDGGGLGLPALPF